jgi:hypothetical protein
MCHIFPSPISPSDYISSGPPTIWPGGSGTVYPLTAGGDKFAAQHCDHCGGWHQGRCPSIKAIEYHENGGVKRVEYQDERDI